MKYYVVNAVKKTIDISTPWGNSSIKLSCADGMVGALAVFTNKKLAKKYAGKVPLSEFESVEI